jgi:hypothetical protein
MFLMDYEISKRCDQNVFYCNTCRHESRAHEIIEIPGPPTGRQSAWGAGLPTVKRYCTGCGAEDGPWLGIFFQQECDADCRPDHI